MELVKGQKVAYPSQGVCMVENIENKLIGENSILRTFRAIGKRGRATSPNSFSPATYSKLRTF